MRRGFTLIELLVAVAIVALLAAMAMPLVGIATRQAKRSNTQAILAKVEAAIGQFRRDVDVLPYQRSYPEAVDPANPFPNELMRRLGRSLAQADHQALLTLAATAAGRFEYPENLWVTGAVEATALPSALTIRMAHLPPSDWNIPWASYGNVEINKRRFCYVLNRMAARRAGDAMLAGAVDLRGPIIAGATNAIATDLSGQSVVSQAEVGDMVGWCDDYLAGELPPSTAAGDAVLDGWGRPLVYVGQLVPRAKPFTHRESQYVTQYTMQSYRVARPALVGMGAQGFAVGTGPWDALKAAGRFALLGSGRVELAGGAALPDAHATYLPDPAQPRRSDRRYYAAPEAGLDVELWSAGPDGVLAWMRDDPANRDNVAGGAYDRGIP